MLSALRNEKRPPYLRATFWADLRAGVTLSASYVPNAMALGVISGMGPLAGLWCGVFVGIIAALFGGTRALVSGPSAVLAVVTATLLVGDQFSLPELALIIVMAGAIQIALGLAGVGRFVSYIPHIVLTGFMSGIGVLLLWSQVQNLIGLGANNLLVALCCLALLLAWPGRLARFLPAVLAVIAFGWILSLFLPGVESLGSVPVGLPAPLLEMPSLEFLPQAFGPAVLIALISSIYTLMWALIADSFTGAQHNPNRELFGLGLGNLAAGIVGLMPGSGTIATMTSRSFGGKTVVAGIICLLIIAALILGLGPYAAPLPLAALSAIVMAVGWKLIDFSFLRKAPKMDPRHSVVMLLIMAVTIFVDPLFAIVFGVIAAYMVRATQLESLELDSVISTPLLDSTFSPGAADPFAARIGLLAFRGSFTVSSSRKLIRLLGADIRDHEVVIIDLSNATHFDDSAAHLLALLIDEAKRTRTGVVVFGMREPIRRTLYAFNVLERIPEERFVKSEAEARDLAWSLL